MRRFHDLRVARARSPLFALTWTIMHPIGRDSPLHGASPESLRTDGVEIIVTLTGIDETFSQPIHARYSFIADDIAWDRRFADILSILPDGRTAVDYSRFHDLTPL
jgi:inward rectifier potassium channel